MKNFYQPGDVMDFTAPTGGVTSGVPVFIGELVVIPVVSAAAGAKFAGVASGAVMLTKADSQAWVEGQKIYWDNANKVATSDNSAGPALGTAAVAVASTAGLTTGYVRLNGTSMVGDLFTIRKRFTIAQVNAGATILPALPGRKYRLVDSKLTAIGGAVGAVTTIDILGTLTTARKLVAHAQANMTQSAVLRAGGTGATVLADGASFTANDVNTGITIGITGSPATTATNIDVELQYAIESA